MDKKNQVIDVLLTPINVIRHSGKIDVSIKKNGKYIETTQTYKRALDPDMSDFAIGFYEIIYKDIFNTSEPILSELDLLSSDAFAGDTMNTFNTIANKVPGAGSSRRQRTSMTDWPDYLQNYSLQYHCLANFWILPMDVGRKIGNKYSKGAGGDYVDCFIHKLVGSFDDYKEKYNEYFKSFFKIDDFYTVHFIGDSYDNYEEAKTLSKYEPKKFVEVATEMMKIRANEISESKHLDCLWEYFNKYGLFD